MKRSVKKSKYIIGIDEAGRGPLAGPVSVGAVCLHVGFDHNLFKGVRDSKKLSSDQRDFWYQRLEEWERQGFLHFHAALISSNIIDKKGISKAIKMGIDECLNILDIPHDDCEIFLDGSLRAPSKYIYQRTIIRGDDLIPVISLASIAAKVTRDRYIIKISKKYPKYKLNIHKGYGTRMHRELIKKHGPSRIHRMSFLRNLISVK
jgi:ribonuclease HII